MAQAEIGKGAGEGPNPLTRTRNHAQRGETARPERCDEIASPPRCRR